MSGLLGLVGIAADPLSSPRAHPARPTSSRRPGRTAGPRPRHAGRPGAAAAAAQARRLRARQVLPARRPHDARHASSTGCWRPRRSRRGPTGAPLDIGTLLRTADGTPGCAIVSIAHLSDEERQFVVTLVLSKLVTWMRRQTGHHRPAGPGLHGRGRGLRAADRGAADEEADHDAHEAGPAFGVGVVLATQNPVDVDYKALSNAGTWMIGRLQTEQDKARLLDGLSAAAGGVDMEAMGDTIGGLDKREFVLRQAGKDTPDVFTTPLGDELPARPADPRPDRDADGRGAKAAAAPSVPAAAARAASAAAGCGCSRLPPLRPLPARRSPPPLPARPQPLPHRRARSRGPSPVRSPDRGRRDAVMPEVPRHSRVLRRRRRAVRPPSPGLPVAGTPRRSPGYGSATTTRRPISSSTRSTRR